jgi:hypothetical protein
MFMIGGKTLFSARKSWESLTNYRLRSISSGLCLPQPRTNSMKNSFMYDGAKLWNSIPNEIRESKSLSCFQKNIAAHIF